MAILSSGNKDNSTSDSLKLKIRAIFFGAGSQGRTPGPPSRACTICLHGLCCDMQRTTCWTAELVMSPRTRRFSGGSMTEDLNAIPPPRVVAAEDFLPYEERTSDLAETGLAADFEPSDRLRLTPEEREELHRTYYALPRAAERP